jgi:ADP-ribose pyrophosphatase YjhB (NUDIX family)
LLQIHDPAALPTPDFWELPGGGVKPGESYEQAAVREVFEETGISELTLGRCVWTGRFTDQGDDGTPMRVVERYYVARADGGLEISFAGHEPLEAATTVGYRWFTLEEIAHREASESFFPRGLAGLFRGLLTATGDATEPLDLSL